MTYFILGAGGRLGRALLTAYSEFNVNTVHRAVTESWLAESGTRAVENFFTRACAGPDDTVLLASGLIDPNLSPSNLNQVNFVMPKNVIEACSTFGMRVVTFGSVMEGDGFARNPYIDSKIRLSKHVLEQVADGHRVLHLRMHTHFGLDMPSKFMFLGNVLDTIVSKKRLKMSSGRQLREFHHLEDEARAIRHIIGADRDGIIPISHRQPVSLREVAESALQYFGLSELLSLNELPDPRHENYTHRFMPHELVRETPFRESLPAINTYLETCVRQWNAEPTTRS